MQTDGTSISRIPMVGTNVVDPWHFGTDPDPGIRASDQWIQLRILLFSSFYLQVANETEKLFQI